MARTDFFFFLLQETGCVSIYSPSPDSVPRSVPERGFFFFAQTFPSLEFSFARAFPWRGGIEFPVSKQDGKGEQLPGSGEKKY